MGSDSINSWSLLIFLLWKSKPNANVKYIQKALVQNLLQFLAHLSQRLIRWAYSIPMVCRCHLPHFQTWISLKPDGQSQPNFMCSITGVGERLHKLWEHSGSKLWFPWQQEAPPPLFSVVFNPILFILAGNKDMHKISNKFKFRPDWTTDYRVSCPWAPKNFPIDL